MRFKLGQRIVVVWIFAALDLRDRRAERLALRRLVLEPDRADKTVIEIGKEIRLILAQRLCGCAIDMRDGRRPCGSEFAVG